MRSQIETTGTFAFEAGTQPQGDKLIGWLRQAIAGCDHIVAQFAGGAALLVVAVLANPAMGNPIPGLGRIALTPYATIWGNAVGDQETERNTRAMAMTNAGDEAETQATHPAPGQDTLQRRGEHAIGAYLGVPYTYPSDVTVTGPQDTDMVVRDVEWEGRPFKHPLYYGIRLSRWSNVSPFGGMLDFTHNKVYSPGEAETSFNGRVAGEDLPARAKIDDVFHKLEFTHGHNTLLLTGLYRLPFQTTLISPYVGAGAGVSLPHSEVQLKKIPGRTYEYQYVGPAGQVLAGLELRFPTHSVFMEYKFTYADYVAPLSGRDGSWLPLDLLEQFKRWWSGEAPPLGWAKTKLASHHLVGGLTLRIKRH